MDLLFWISVGVIAYVYFGYPMVLGVWAALVARSRPWRHGGAENEIVPEDSASPRLRGQEGTDLPAVSVVIAARDEARRLPARLDNLLASDYPADRLQIVVASDGSTDDTAEALAPYADRITLLLLPASGKAGALNAGVRAAIHPVLVFADARQRFAPDAIRRLVSHFADPAIGAVSGELILDCEDAGRRADLKVGPYTNQTDESGMSGDVKVGPYTNQMDESGAGASDVGADLQVGPRPSTIADGVGTYWRYEKWLRRRESIVGSTLGVTGAIYAMQRRLWRPLPPDTILDDVMAPMRVVLAGYRVAFDEQAHAFDDASPDASTELRRKSRTLSGNYQLLAREPRLLLPVVNPVWLQFVSHKVGRLVVPYALLALLISSAWLAFSSALYALALGAQLAFYGLAAYGALLDRRTTQAPPAHEVFREAA